MMITIKALPKTKKITLINNSKKIKSSLIIHIKTEKMS